MKLQKSIIAIIALFIFALAATSAAFAQSDNDNWVTFSKIQAGSNERSNATIKSFGCGDSIYATANFSEAVDVSDGFTVSIFVDGDVVRQEKMNGGATTSVTETIHVELVPDDNAVVRYPTATILYAQTLLKDLSAGNHKIEIAVNPGTEYDTLATGEFQFNNASGCKQRFERAKRKLNKDIAELERRQKEMSEQKTEEVEEDNDSTQQQQEEQQRPTQTESKKTTMVEIQLQGSCGTSRLVTIVNNPASSYPQKDTLWVGNGSDSRRVPVGAEIYLKAEEGSDTVLIYKVGSASRQTVKVCQ